MRSGGSTWLLPARSFFIGCGAGLAAAAWNPTNVCPRLLCPFRSIVATLALPSCRHSCRSARVLRGHFGGPFCERACLDSLDSCLDKTTSSNFKFSSSLKFCCLDAPPPQWQVKKAACGWVAGWVGSGLGSARGAVRGRPATTTRLYCEEWSHVPLSGRCLDAVWTRCLDAVWTLSGRCLDTVWTGSGLSRQVRELHKPGLLCESS